MGRRKRRIEKNRLTAISNIMMKIMANGWKDIMKMANS